MITSHNDRSPVERYITVKGTSQGIRPEWSIYSYARAKIQGQPWWLSEKRATVTGDDWNVDVVIGDEQTPPGTEFEVAIVVANGKPIGPSTSDLPDAVEPCATLSLVRK